MSDLLIIAGREFRSRLIVGTGKYKSFQETARALEASGAEMVTIAVRRVNLDRSKESLLDYLDAISRREELGAELRRFHRDYDLLITPAAPIPPPSRCPRTTLPAPAIDTTRRYGTDH